MIVGQHVDQVDMQEHEFFVNFMMAYLLNYGDFQQDLANNAYDFGFYDLCELLVAHQVPLPKMLQVLDDAFALMNNTDELLKIKDIPVFLRKLNEGYLDHCVAFEHDPYISPEQLPHGEEIEAATINSSNPFVRGVQDLGLQDAIIQLLLDLKDTKILQAMHLENNEQNFDFIGNFLNDLAEGGGIDPETWQYEDTYTYGSRRFNFLLSEMDVEINIAAHLANVALSFMSSIDMMTKNRASHLMDGLLDGYNSHQTEQRLPLFTEFKELSGKKSSKDKLANLASYRKKKNRKKRRR